MDLVVRTGQERVKILDRRKEGRKEGRAREDVEREEEEETGLAQVRAREKNWIVGKDRKRNDEGKGRGFTKMSRDQFLYHGIRDWDNAWRRGLEWKTKRSFSI